MDEQKRKDVHEMTPDELWRELFDRLGYFVATIDSSASDIGKEEYALCCPDGRILSHQNEDFFYVRIYLDFPHFWPNNIGAAFELCINVVDRLNALLSDSIDFCVLVTGQSDVYLERNSLIEHGSHILYIATGRDALALSRLALLALRELGGDDG